MIESGLCQLPFYARLGILGRDGGRFVRRDIDEKLLSTDGRPLARDNLHDKVNGSKTL